MIRNWFSRAVGAATLVGAALALLPGAAQAEPININFVFAEGTSNEETLILTGDVSITSISESSATLALSLTNSSTAGARLTSFGFDLVPGATGLTVTSNDLGWNVAFNQSITSVAVDVCVYAGPNCSGGGGGGLMAGNSLSGTIVLGGAFDLATTVQDFVARFQSVGVNNQGSIVIRDPEGNGGGGGGGTPVPLPGTIALLGLGLLAAGFARSRKT